MDDMAFVKATTRLRREDQYLNNEETVSQRCDTSQPYFVTLNTLNSLRALRAEMPKEFALGL